MDFSKTLVTVAFALIIIFTIAVLYIFWQTGSEPSTLITAFFAAILGEFGFLAWIRTNKTRSGRDERS